jgi:uridine kinase
VQQLRRGNVIDAPLYDFTTHCRDPLRTTRIDPKPIIIVEGVLVFANAELCTLLNLKIFIDTPEEVRRQRRVERDARERGRSVESTNAQWNESVQPMHQEFCEPSKAVADIVIDGRDNLQKTGESLWSIVWNRAQSHESIGCGVEQ